MFMRSLRSLAAGVLLAACDPTPTPATLDAAADGALDTTPDRGADVVPDTAPDVRPDAAPDGSPDAAMDAAMDARVDAGPPVEIQVLHFSDWHGQIDPLSASRAGPDGGTVNAPIAGAAALAAWFQRDRMMNPNTLTVTAGDEFGASPPIASFFEEEPAAVALNAMGLQVSTFGNHNFDRGIPHLQTMIGRARWQYVSSNLDALATNLMNVRGPYHIETVGGVRVGLVGITNPDAPMLSAPGRLGTLTVRDPVTAAMDAQRMARAAGAQVVIALCHLGATGTDAMMNPTGPLIDFARGVSGFDAILGDHTDVRVNTTINGQTVVENRSKGLTYARLRMTVDRNTGAVSGRRVELVDPWVGDVTPDPAVTAAIEPFRTRLAAQLDGTIGVASNTLPRGSNVERLGEVAIGDLISDCMRERYGTQIAFVNGGGIRAALPSTYAPMNRMLRRPAMGYAMGPPFDLVAGDIYEVLPFGNVVVTRTITGRLLYDVLERSVSMLPAAFGGFLQVSGIRFTYSPMMPAGMRVRAVTLAGGAAIARDNTSYTLATSDFTNTGGDGYTMLADGTGASRELMAAVVLECVRTRGGAMPTTDGRIAAAP
jgi:5'-nucleotidase